MEECREHTKKKQIIKDKEKKWGDMVSDKWEPFVDEKIFCSFISGKEGLNLLNTGNFLRVKKN